ncbi:ribose-phosphate pyrophosphokinase [Anaerotignum neopropionicum]|uniref:Ribose-phosphate pyrophosphokinase n=1 Tax=Anaerotignum neopropionicum TaxID=36847 RepID=A0A136WBY5_9FIRM|nr:ComF family protein [Anaerotignum neopropionicum]KXL52025.1 ribose-phosphate pyrophosphokinase [Anaerotignum neopropionicum]
MKSFVERFLNVLYPPYCVLCGELLSIEEWEMGLCKSCGENIPYLKGNRCKFCGKELEFGEVCHSCLENNPVFERGISAFYYEALKDGIARFKFDGAKKDGKIFGRLMGEFLRSYHKDWIEEIDFMTSVPLHPLKEKERGFNQAEILCSSIHESTGIGYQKNILTRTKPTTPQSKLSAKERRENLRNVFTAQNCEDKCILLVDDILTTGATLNECSRALYRQGAKKVEIFCLSVTR